MCVFYFFRWTYEVVYLLVAPSKEGGCCAEHILVGVLHESASRQAERSTPAAPLEALMCRTCEQDPAAWSAAIREGLADRHPAVVKAAGEMVFS